MWIILLRIRDVSDKDYRIENVILSGADSSNYSLSSNVIIGNDGELIKDQFIICPPKKPMMVPTSSLGKIHQSRNHITPAQLMKMKLSFWIQLMTMVMPPLVVSLTMKISSYIINHTNASVGTISSKHVTGPDDHKETYGLPRWRCLSYSDTDNYITKIVLTDDGGGSEPSSYKLQSANS